MYYRYVSRCVTHTLQFPDRLGSAQTMRSRGHFSNGLQHIIYIVTVIEHTACFLDSVYSWNIISDYQFLNKYTALFEAHLTIQFFHLITCMVLWRYIQQIYLRLLQSQSLAIDVILARMICGRQLTIKATKTIERRWLRWFKTFGMVARRTNSNKHKWNEYKMNKMYQTIMVLEIEMMTTSNDLVKRKGP